MLAFIHGMKVSSLPYTKKAINAIPTNTQLQSRCRQQRTRKNFLDRYTSRDID